MIFIYLSMSVCLSVCLSIHLFIYLFIPVIVIGTPSGDPLHPDYCPHLNMGYGCQDNLKAMERYQRQLKRQKLTEKGCESKSQSISSVLSSPCICK